jgi:inner membrane protein
MMFFSHAAFGLLAGIGGCAFTGCSSLLVFVAISSTAALLPDMDHTSSFLGRRLKPFSIIFRFLFRHRGLLHSFLPAFLLYGALALTTTTEIASAAFIGYASHLILDALTPQGVRPFWPLKYRIRGPIRTKSIGEKVLFTLLVTGALLLTIRALR